MDRKRDPLLPYAEIVSEKMAVKLRNPLNHCLYKRVIIWTALSLFMAAFVLFGKHDGIVRDVTPKHTTTENGASPITAEGSNIDLFYEGDEDESADEEAQRIIDAARNGQDQSQIQVTPSKSGEKRPSQEQNDVAEQDDDDEDESSGDNSEEMTGSRLPSSGKSAGKGSKTNAAGKSDVSHADDDDLYDEDEDEDVPEYDQHAEESEMNLLLEGENTDQLKQELENLKRMPWLRFPQ